MKIEKLNKQVASLLGTILQKYCYDCSSVLALVGYRLVINSIEMTEIGGSDSAGYLALALNPLAPEELTHEDFAYFLVASKINCLDYSKISKIELSESVDGYSYTYEFTPDDKAEQGRGSLCVRSNDIITSTEKKLDLNGCISNIKLELLFVKRNELAKLPVEFEYFRKYKGWLTLAKSISAIGEVFIESSDTLSSIIVELKDERLKNQFCTDLREVSDAIATLQ